MHPSTYSAAFGVFANVQDTHGADGLLLAYGMYNLISGLIFVGINILCLVSSVGILKRNKRAVKPFLIWAVLEIVFTVLFSPAAIFFECMLFMHQKENAAIALLVGVFILMIILVFLAFPVTAALWMRRTVIKEEIKTWQ